MSLGHLHIIPMIVQSDKGASIKYVRTEGGGGSEKVGKIAYACTFALYMAAIFCVQGEGGGLKISLLMRTYLMDAPQHVFDCCDRPRLFLGSRHIGLTHKAKSPCAPRQSQSQ